MYICTNGRGLTWAWVSEDVNGRRPIDPDRRRGGRLNQPVLPTPPQQQRLPEPMPQRAEQHHDLSRGFIDTQTENLSNSNADLTATQVKHCSSILAAILRSRWAKKGDPRIKLFNKVDTLRYYTQELSSSSSSTRGRGGRSVRSPHGPILGAVEDISSGQTTV